MVRSEGGRSLSKGVMLNCMEILSVKVSQNESVCEVIMPIYQIIPTLATTYLRDLNRTMCQCSFGHLCSSKMTAINRNEVMCDFRILTLSFSIILHVSLRSSYVSLERAV